jgi:hypothetical protein
LRMLFVCEAHKQCPKQKQIEYLVVEYLIMTILSWISTELKKILEAKYGPITTMIFVRGGALINNSITVADEEIDELMKDVPIGKSSDDWKQYTLAQFIEDCDYENLHALHEKEFIGIDEYLNSLIVCFDSYNGEFHEIFKQIHDSMEDEFAKARLCERLTLVQKHDMLFRMTDTFIKFFTIDELIDFGIHKQNTILNKYIKDHIANASSDSLLKIIRAFGYETSNRVIKEISKRNIIIKHEKTLLKLCSHVKGVKHAKKCLTYMDNRAVAELLMNYPDITIIYTYVLNHMKILSDENLLKLFEMKITYRNDLSKEIKARNLQPTSKLGIVLLASCS